MLTKTIAIFTYLAASILLTYALAVAAHVAT